MSEISKKLQNTADYFIIKSNEDGLVITNKKLQKLAYYAQAWNLVLNNGSPLFDDPIEAWMHGPAIRALWHKYRENGFSPIAAKPKTPTFSDDESFVLSEVWRVYGRHDADYLEALTHSEEPWLNARRGLDASDSSSIVIDINQMKDYYTRLNAQGA